VNLNLVQSLFTTTPGNVNCNVVTVTTLKQPVVLPETVILGIHCESKFSTTSLLTSTPGNVNYNVVTVTTLKQPVVLPET